MLKHTPEASILLRYHNLRALPILLKYHLVFCVLTFSHLNISSNITIVYNARVRHNDATYLNRTLNSIIKDAM